MFEGCFVPRGTFVGDVAVMLGAWIGLFPILMVSPVQGFGVWGEEVL